MENLYELPWLQPRNDAVFKCLFGKHADILQSFLENVLDLSSVEYQGIKCIDTNQRYDPESKLTILDLKLETNTGKLINVEMQLLLLKSLIQRILFYLSQMLVGQLEPNQKYKNLKRVISVLIINEEMFPEDELLHHCFRFADKHVKIELTDLMEVNILELSKAREKKNIETPLDVWLKFLAADKKEEFMQLAEQNAGVRSACMVLKELSADKRTRLEAEQREKAWRDEMDRIDGAREEGIQIGKEIGQEIGEKEGSRKKEWIVLKNMRKDGCSLEKMAEYIELDIETVKKLLNEI